MHLLVGHGPVEVAVLVRYVAVERCDRRVDQLGRGEPPFTSLIARCYVCNRKPSNFHRQSLTGARIRQMHTADNPSVSASLGCSPVLRYCWLCLERRSNFGEPYSRHTSVNSAAAIEPSNSKDYFRFHRGTLLAQWKTRWH
jgi:hypothetical protein